MSAPRPRLRLTIIIGLGALALTASLAAGCASSPEDSYYNRGVRLQSEGRLPAAARAYREAIDDDPEDARAHFNLGTIYQEIGKPGKAKASYETVLRLRDDARAHVNLAAILEAEERPADALRHLDAAVALAEESAFPWCYRGAFHLRQGDAARARADFLAGIEAEPEDPTCHLRLGQMLRAEGKPLEGRDRIEEATRLDPGSVPAWTAFGEIARELEDTGAAIRAYERLATLTPDRVEVFLALAELYLHRRKPASAIFALERAAAITSPDLATRRLRLQAATALLESELEASKEDRISKEDMDRIRDRLHELWGGLEGDRPRGNR